MNAGEEDIRVPSPIKTPQRGTLGVRVENKDPRPSFALPARRHPIRRPLLRLPKAKP
jgi:hypothetical protein